MRVTARVVLWLAIAASTGCTTGPADQGDFRPYLDRFAAEAVARGRHVDVSDVQFAFGTPFPAAAVASCFATPFGWRRVVVNRGQWDGIAPACREIFAFHELGHCVLNRVHLNERLADGTPASMMNFDTVPCGLYRERRARYLDELFAPAP